MKVNSPPRVTREELYICGTQGSALPLSGSRDYQRTVRPTPFDHRDVREAIVAHQLDVE